MLALDTYYFIKHGYLQCKWKWHGCILCKHARFTYL